MSEMTGDTLMPPGARRPDLRPASDASIDRPMPCDPPGTLDAGGWKKMDAGNSSGWDRIDDVDGGMDAGWCQT